MRADPRRPRLLVSVRGPAEAATALQGGADIIDAKDPFAGALGAVSTRTLRTIVAAVAGARPVTAALGDAVDAYTVERDAAAYAAEGAALVKLGFAGISSRSGIGALVTAAVRGARASRVIAVAYADGRQAGSAAPEVILDIAARLRLHGVLIDTADKAGPPLTSLMTADALCRLADAAHRDGLVLALAGRIGPLDLPVLQHVGADIVGVRGAACDAGRFGRVTMERVQQLRALCDIAPGGLTT